MIPSRLRFAALVLAVVVPLQCAACADQQRIWFENQFPTEVTVSVDGDRLLILAPYTGQFLPYTTAAWAWPRRIDIHERQSGVLLMSETLNADGLVEANWTFYVRP